MKLEGEKTYCILHPYCLIIHGENPYETMSNDIVTLVIEPHAQSKEFKLPLYRFFNGNEIEILNRKFYLALPFELCFKRVPLRIVNCHFEPKIVHEELRKFTLMGLLAQIEKTLNYCLFDVSIGAMFEIFSLQRVFNSKQILKLAKQLKHAVRPYRLNKIEQILGGKNERNNTS